MTVARWPGRLKIPLPNGDGRKPGWIVDGQQRALALARSRRQDFPVPVNAFVADSVELQRDQFLRINNTRPLPRGLVTELLPEIGTPLPPRLSLRQTPSALCDLLNRDPDSPFCGLIRRPSGSKEQRGKAVITDTSIIQMLQESLTTPSGCLFPYRNPSNGETDFAGLWKALLMYWTAVRDTFPEAWGKPPTQSRLMHGAGIRAMGRLMDRLMAAIDPGHADAASPDPRRPGAAGAQLPVDLGAVGGTGPALEPDREPAPAHARTVQFPHPHPYAGQGRSAMKFFFPDSQDQIDPGFDFDHRGAPGPARAPTR